VVVARGQAPIVELEADELRELVEARLLEHVDERTPRFVTDGAGRFLVRRELTTDRGGVDPGWSGQSDASATGSTHGGGSAASSGRTESVGRSP